MTAPTSATPTCITSPNAPRNPLRLSVALLRILESAKSQPLTLGMIIDTTQERAFGVLMAFLCLPFLLPISIPGSSIPFGLALMVVGAQLALGKHRPWLPTRLRQWNLPRAASTKLIALLARVFRPLEKIIWPRMLIMQNPMSMFLIGIALLLDGFLLALPWPPFVPFSNQIPAVIAFIKIIGITEDDGVCLILGMFLTFALIIGLVVAIVLGGETALAWWQGPPSTLPAR